MSKKMLIFWDIDGTLMYCGSDGTIALSRTFEELYGVEDAFHQVGIGRAMDSVIVNKIMNKFNIPQTDLAKIKATYVDKLEEILDQDADKRALPGIRELIYYAEREGHINSLLTSNMRIGADVKLRSVNLDGHFTGGGFGDETGEKWDIARHAQKEIEAMAGNKFNPAEVIVIGDSAYDIETARKCGYNIISVATGWTDAGVLEEADPDVLFDNFGDAEAVMDAIARMSRGE